MRIWFRNISHQLQLDGHLILNRSEGLRSRFPNRAKLKALDFLSIKWSSERKIFSLSTFEPVCADLPKRHASSHLGQPIETDVKSVL
jgi:hypothetical protein